MKYYWIQWNEEAKDEVMEHRSESALTTAPRPVFYSYGEAEKYRQRIELDEDEYREELVIHSSETDDFDCSI